MDKAEAKKILISKIPNGAYVSKAERGKFPLLSEVSVDAKSLYDAFFAEPEQSLETYDGVRLRVHGVASRVGIDIHGMPSVEMSDRVNGECFVLCVFRDSDILKQVQVGEEVTIEGNYLVFYDGFGITMKNSELIGKCEERDGAK